MARQSTNKYYTYLVNSVNSVNIRFKRTKLSKKKKEKKKETKKRNKYRTFDDVAISPSKSTSRFVYRRSFVVRPMNCIGITEMECKRRPAVTYRLQSTIGIVSIYLACTIIRALVKIRKPKIKKINKFAKFYVISKRKIVC